MTESKEWVTIKIPKDTRDRAKEDSRTYEGIMEDGLDSDPELHVDHEVADQIKEELENYQPEVDLDELEDRIVVRIAREKEADIATVEQNILNRLDDLQSQLPNDVAGELR